MQRQQIKEKDGVHKEWYKEARKQTIETLPDFLKKLSENYSHDYGTICHAVASAAIGAAWAMDKLPQGGITGFQAGAIMWEFIRHWNYSHNKTGLRIVNYDDMLYPQYSDKFGKMISSHVWESLQKQAQANINEYEEKYEKYLVEKEQYDKDLKAFKEKYPDYDEDPEKYEHLSAGTWDQWDAYHEKEKSGFEFAPKQPHDPTPALRVLEHWRSIVSGKVPFNYVVNEE